MDLKASDPRDKLFALLGLGRETWATRQVTPALQPDYDKPVANVMADFTRWWISEHRSLGILSLVHFAPASAWQRMLLATAFPALRKTKLPICQHGSSLPRAALNGPN
jgi:hypothetical protein